MNRFNRKYIFIVTNWKTYSNVFIDHGVIKSPYMLSNYLVFIHLMFYYFKDYKYFMTPINFSSYQSLFLQFSFWINFFICYANVHLLNIVHHMDFISNNILSANQVLCFSLTEALTFTLIAIIWLSYVILPFKI